MDALENNPESRLIQGLSFGPSSTFRMETLHQRCVHSALIVSITHWSVGRGRIVNSRLLCDCNPLSKSIHGGLCSLRHAVCSTSSDTGELWKSSEDPRTSHTHGFILLPAGGKDLTNSDLSLKINKHCLRGPFFIQQELPLCTWTSYHLHQRLSTFGLPATSRRL